MTWMAPHEIQIVAVGDAVGFERPQEIVDCYENHEGDEIGMYGNNGEQLLTFKPADAASDPAPKAATP